MSNGFTAKPQFFNAMGEILEHPDCTPDVSTFISGIVRTVQQTGYVSERQAVCAGGTYKAIVNGGRYVRHDWWH